MLTERFSLVSSLTYRFIIKREFHGGDMFCCWQYAVIFPSGGVNS